MQDVTGEPVDKLKSCDEEWRAIPGYEGYYEASNFGRIRSWYVGGGYKLTEPRLKKIQSDKDGYPFVLLYKHREVQGFRVARLVLYTFVGTPERGMEASHMDGNKKNNFLGNLGWETRMQNEQHKVEHGTRPMGQAQWSSKVTEDEVRELRNLRAQGWKLIELAGRFGVTPTTISQICRKVTWAHVE